MSYQSGRTVKTRRPAPPTTIASATTAARRAIARHLPDVTGIHVASTNTAHPVTFAPQVRTRITCPDGTKIGALAVALAAQPGVVGAVVDANSPGITITRTA